MSGIKREIASTILPKHIGKNGIALRHICPSCHGGSTKEYSFVSILEDTGEFKYICHRASCGLSPGVLGAHRHSNVDNKVLKKRKEIAVYEGHIYPLTDCWYDYVYKQYLIDGTLAGESCLSCTDDYRLAIPVYSSRGLQTGIVLRNCRYKVSLFPKVEHYIYDADNWICLAYRKTNTSCTNVVLVEDMLSQIRASVYVNTFALLGTHINQEKVKEIQSVLKPGDKVFLALDADATHVAVKLWKRYRHELPLTVLRLTKDFKNMSDKEITTTLTKGGIIKL